MLPEPEGDGCSVTSRFFGGAGGVSLSFEGGGGVTAHFFGVTSRFFGVTSRFFGSSFFGDWGGVSVGGVSACFLVFTFFTFLMFSSESELAMSFFFFALPGFRFLRFSTSELSKLSLELDFDTFF